MNYLLLTPTLIACVASLAQQPTPAANARDRDAHSGRYVGPFSLKYQNGYLIARPAFLYRTLRDAQRGHYAHRLRIGDEVYSNQTYSPHVPWLRVARFTYEKGTVPRSDATLYYLRASAVLDKAGTMRTFSLQ